MLNATLQDNHRTQENPENNRRLDVMLEAAVILVANRALERGCPPAELAGVIKGTLPAPCAESIYETNTPPKPKLPAPDPASVRAAELLLTGDLEAAQLIKPEIDSDGWSRLIHYLAVSYGDWVDLAERIAHRRFNTELHNLTQHNPQQPPATSGGRYLNLVDEFFHSASFTSGSHTAPRQPV